jgi:hypothetical protein
MIFDEFVKLIKILIFALIGLQIADVLLAATAWHLTLWCQREEVLIPSVSGRPGLLLF